MDQKTCSLKYLEENNVKKNVQKSFVLISHSCKTKLSCFIFNLKKME